MTNAQRGFLHTAGLLLFILLGLFVFIDAAASKTIVKATGKCDRTVTVNIELHSGGFTWTEEEMEKFTPTQKKNIQDLMAGYSNYSEAELAKIGAEFKAEFEKQWNGPTKEQVENAREELGIKDSDLRKAVKDDFDLRNEIGDKVEKHLEQFGGSPSSANCTEINCCKIYFKMNVKVRKHGDKADPEYHQIKIMNKKWRSSVTTHDDGLQHNHKGTSGKWAYDPNNKWGASAAHECGHLMGLDDQYTDEGGTKPGHDHDIMDDSFGYPQEDALQEILTIAGVPCDCCKPKTEGGSYADDIYQEYAMTALVANDAVLVKNCEHMKAALSRHKRLLEILPKYPGLSVTQKADLTGKLNQQIKKLNEGLKDCDKPRPTTGTTTGDDPAISTGQDAGIPYIPFSYDSLQCTTYGGGSVAIPNPNGFTPGYPVFPTGPTQGPASTPGSSGDGVDWKPVGPGGGAGLTNPKPVPTFTGGTDSVYLPPYIEATDQPGSGANETPVFGVETPQTPATGKPGNPKTLVPFGKYDYDDNENIIKGGLTFENEEDYNTPYDGWDVPRDSTYDGDEGSRRSDGRGTFDIGRTLQTPGTEEKEEEEDEPTSTPPTWLIFKAEQDVVQQDGSIQKGPAETSVLKLGFPPPKTPGTDAVRTAEDTNAGASDEPRFVVTDDDGYGYFQDGFETGDTTSWTDAGNQRKVSAPAGDDAVEDGTPAANVVGFTLDATPMKSRIVYLDARFVTAEDNFLAEVGTDFDYNIDDVNANGQPDWTEIGGTAQDPAVQKALGEGGLLNGSPIEPKTGDDPAQPGPNTPAGGGGGQGDLPDNLKGYVSDTVQFGNTIGATLTYKYWEEDEILNALNGYTHQYNRYLKEKVDDPYFNSEGTWGQNYDDQWAIKSVGFTGEDGDAWEAAGDDLAPVIIAFIDTGLDWNHADLSWDNIWVNPGEIPDNGIDDDMNGYVDDMIGWDFYTNSGVPWDQDGHGTFTAGMVIAQKDNGVGISGINPAAKVMVLKALNDFGHTRASFVAKAIKYAVDNGARIINLSIGAEHQTYLERLAISYAHQNGVLVVAAAGNESTDITTYGFAPYEEVIAVASSDFEGKRVFFSNLGPEIDIAAPGLDVLSLRARMTDFMRNVKHVEYEDGSAYVGEDNRYFRSSGTSFSAPIITGIASLILSKNPELSAEEVKRMLLNSARDVELPGTDQFTGYGVVDAVAAINADPAFEIVADIAAVNAVQDNAGNFFVKVDGSALANDFDAASVQIGVGDTPSEFKEVARIGAAVDGDQLALIPANEFRTAPTWTIRLVVRHKNGRTREQWFVLQLG